jgi:ferrous iron transport protein B
MSVTAPPEPATPATAAPTVVLAGNPNAGKTTLFNALTGLRAKTANFPGTTVSRRAATIDLGHGPVTLVDLPGMYSLKPTTPEERIARDALVGGDGAPRPAAAVLIADSTNLERNLFLVSQVLEQDVPVVVALNMIDAARQEGIRIDAQGLARELGCPVVPVSARTGEGLDELRGELGRLLRDGATRIPILGPSGPACNACRSCPFQQRYQWTEGVVSRHIASNRAARGARTEAIDRVLTHPMVGLIAFFTVMACMFFLLFHIASIPMDMIDHLFATIGNRVGRWLPEGDLRSLVVDGVIGGVGGILVFLPQICILFLFLALLEDTGYLARAAFVMDRLMRRIGLPGKAFVPLLSAHACAIPAILSTRVIEDRRDRLMTILIAPLMSCSARIPVYTMVIALLFPHRPLLAAMTFLGAYALGIIAALTAAFTMKRTILPGETRPLVLELPNYRLPSLRTAFLHMFDQASVFVRQAGTLILVISVVLWALATYPKSEPPAHTLEMREHAEALLAQGAADEAAALAREADQQDDQYALAHSFAGRLGRWIEPVIAPLGFNWQIGIGLVTSFAAREVIVSTLAVVYGVGSSAEEDERSLYDTLRSATRTDGSPVFTTATGFSLLVFYILAAQCLPTQAATRKETGSWKWAGLQLAYMTVLAYVGALVTFQILRACGIT